MPDSEPLVSVVVPTYNRARLLPRAVNSVLSQTHKNLEVIIVDDGSTDNTEELCRAFEDKRIRYCRQERNKGVLAAKNKGFDLARGDYIAGLDDDDELPRPHEARSGPATAPREGLATSCRRRSCCTHDPAPARRPRKSRKRARPPSSRPRRTGPRRRLFASFHP